MLRHRIPAYYLFVTAIVVLALALLAMRELPELASTPAPAPTPARTAEAPRTCSYRTVRLSGYEGIRPLILSEPECEAARYADMKQDIATVVEQYRSSGVLTSAAVYVRDFRKGEWTSFNDGEQFDPGSLLKVPLMLTYLRMAEDDPSVLSRRYTLWKVDPRMPRPIFPPSQQITTGKEYTVEELLRFGIERSDNLAVTLLMQHVDEKAYKRTYLELGLAAPELNASRHPMTARDYSVFMKALFNSTYLSIHNSEFAMSLLRHTDFNDGLRRGVPESTDVAHKFGEYSDGTSMQLHDSGIVYLQNNPYAITILTKGPDVAKLPEAIGALSGAVYQRMSGF
ncbi:MAG: serine hydrolase [Bacteroidetes bacterium]|nr:serine hydrolase [Bacteroidota bacterium]